MFRIIITVLTPLLTLPIIVSCEVEEILPSDSERVVWENYHPFAEEGKTWIFSCGIYDKKDQVLRDDNTKPAYKYQMKGDTVISGFTYLKTFASDEAAYGDTLWHYVGAARDTLLKAQFVDADGRRERLLYDFGLTWGNVMQWYGTIISDSGKQLYHIEGCDRRAVFFSRNDGGNAIIGVWVEGIGEATNGVFDPIGKRHARLLRCYDRLGCCYDRNHKYKVTDVYDYE